MKLLYNNPKNKKKKIYWKDYILWKVLKTKKKLN